MKDRWIFILLLSIGITACEDINRRNPVPIVPVDYTLYVSSQFPNFMVDHGFQTMTITQKNMSMNSSDTLDCSSGLEWMEITTPQTYVALFA